MKPSSRAGYLQTISDMLGPKPPRIWQEEWTELVVEKNGVEESVEESLAGQQKYIKKLVREYGWDQEHAEAYMLLASVRPPPRTASPPPPRPPPPAPPHPPLSLPSSALQVAQPLARGLKEKVDCYAASTYALCEAVQHGVQLQRKRHSAEGAHQKFAPDVRRTDAASRPLRPSHPRAPAPARPPLTSVARPRRSCSRTSTARAGWSRRTRRGKG